MSPKQGSLRYRRQLSFTNRTLWRRKRRAGRGKVWRSGLVSCTDPLPMFVTNPTSTEDQNFLSCFVAVSPCTAPTTFSSQITF